MFSLLKSEEWAVTLPPTRRGSSSRGSRAGANEIKKQNKKLPKKDRSLNKNKKNRNYRFFFPLFNLPPSPQLSDPLNLCSGTFFFFFFAVRSPLNSSNFRNPPVSLSISVHFSEAGSEIVKWITGGVRVSTKRFSIFIVASIPWPLHLLVHGQTTTTSSSSSWSATAVRVSDPSSQFFISEIFYIFMK